MSAARNIGAVELLDGDEQHARYPETFWMPPLAERQALQEGDRVKLVFQCEPAGKHKWTGERMWVRVMGREPEGTYYGILIDAPLFLKNVDFDEEVVFEPRHIIDFERAEAT